MFSYYPWIAWLKFIMASLSSMWEEWGMFVFHDRGNHKLQFQFRFHKVIEANCFRNRNLSDCLKWILAIFHSFNLLSDAKCELSLFSKTEFCGIRRNPFGLLIGKPSGFASSFINVGLSFKTVAYFWIILVILSKCLKNEDIC